MKKVVYIASMGHSGTTLLDLVVGQHSKFVGLGEIFSVLDAGLGFTGLEHTKRKRAPCSCGNNDCRTLHSNLAFLTLLPFARLRQGSGG